MSEEQKAENITPVQAATSAAPVAMKMEFTKKGKAIIIGSVTSVVAIAAVVVFLLWPKTEEVQVPERAGAKFITQENVLDLQREVEERVARGMFETHMNMNWSFPDGHSPSTNAIMGNSPNNNFAFYFTVTLRDTGEVVFTSGLLPVGTEIAEVVLDTPLEAGTYPAVVHVNMIDDDGEPVDSNMGFNITLRIRA